MSYEFTNYINKVPEVEKYTNNIYVSKLAVGNYLDEKNRNFNYFVLDQSDENSFDSYILRVRVPIKNHQVFACGAGGHGGLMYGTGANGGNYIYINTTDDENTDKLLAIGSYLIIPGKSLDCLGILNNNNAFRSIMNSITLNGFFYLIRYNDNNFREYKSTSIEVFDSYKKRDWFQLPAVDNSYGEIISIDKLYANNYIRTKIDNYNNTPRTIELIFYLKKGTSFKFTDFSNYENYYTRIIKVSNTANINTTFIPTSDNNYLYIAGDYDEVISIVCFPNSTIETQNKIDWTTLFDVPFCLSNKNNFYVYDFNKRNEFNQIDELVMQISNTYNEKNTYLFYNPNPDASLEELQMKISKFYLGLQGGVDGGIIDITTNRNIDASAILRRYYMPYLFNVQKSANLFGGASGSTFYSNYNTNVLIKKLGGGSDIIKLGRVNQRNIQLDPSSREWMSGFKGYFSNYFRLYAYYPLNQNIELNNGTVSNGGLSGYWQFLKDEINYNYGANGINDLTSPNYGAYGCGGQGGSVLIDRNSRFTGSRGKNGVFVLSFINYPIASIDNPNPSVIATMASTFSSYGNNENETTEGFAGTVVISGRGSNKLSYINELDASNKNLVITNYSDNQQQLIKKLLFNSYIREANVQLDPAILTTMETWINRANLSLLIASVYIIQRIYYILALNIDNVDITKINRVEINFTNERLKEGLESNINSQLLTITIYDKFDEEPVNIPSNNLGYKYLKAYFEGSNKSNFGDFITELKVKRKIIIAREGGVIYDYSLPARAIIDDSYNQNNDYYKFIINTISYLFDIQEIPKDFKINVNLVEVYFKIFRLNLIFYAIIYYNITTTNNNYTPAMINTVYENLKNYNFDVKSVADNVKEYDNVFLQQNDFKLYFNKKLNEYDEISAKNIHKENIVKSKKAYMEAKKEIKKVVNITTIVVAIVAILVFVWLLFIILSNYSEYDAVPQLLLLLLILIIGVIVVYYVSNNYSYQEFFTTLPVVSANQIVITNNLTYIQKDVNYNRDRYKVYYITDSAKITFNKKTDTVLIFISKGDDASITNDGTGGTISIYDETFITNNLDTSFAYDVTFTNRGASITINDKNLLIKTNPREALDVVDNIKVFYNGIAVTNNYLTLKSYYDNQISTGTTTTSLILKRILSILFEGTGGTSGYFYGARGNTIYTPPNSASSVYINKIAFPTAYGLGGDKSSSIDKTGNNGALIIMTKDVEFSSVHPDLQTQINQFNANINKIVYDKFNSIYLIDNSIIYDNAFISYKKSYKNEEVKGEYLTTRENVIHDYSHNILSDVYSQFEFAKALLYVVIIIVLGVIFYLFFKNYKILITFFTILAIFIVVIYFILATKKNTRKDYYKYYWSKKNKRI